MQSKKDVLSEGTQSKHYKYPLVLLGLYVTFLLITVIAANRLTRIGSLLEPGGIYFFPLTFPILDIVGEVYGYSYPRLFIWVGAFAELSFAFALTGVAHLPAPDYFYQIEAYQVVCDPTVRFVVSSILGTVVGEFLNIYLLAKSKIRLKGRSYVARSILTTAVGQAALTIIVDVLAFSGRMSCMHLLWMMLCGYLYKMLYAFIFAFPSWVVIKKLKETENIDYFDINTNFNPFRLDIEACQQQCAREEPLKS